MVIEREMNGYAPIMITCSAKDNNLSVAKLDSNTVGTIKLPTNIGIEYGCGIGPKIVLSNHNGGIAAIVNQRSSNK